MPDDAPMSKVEAARGQGAIVHIGGGSVDECLELAHERAREGGLAFVHPFDDPDIVAGQGSLGLELLEDVPDLAKVIVPVGGGGLCSRRGDRRQGGAAGRRGDRRAGRRLLALPESLRRGEPVPAGSALTIADGIAVKRPGDLTLGLLARYADGVVVRRRGPGGRGHGAC